MAKFSKFFGSIIGSVVGLILAFVASKGFGTCDALGENCVVFGFTQETITVAIMGILSAVGVYGAPANE